jgi:hypothetical protein
MRSAGKAAAVVALVQAPRKHLPGRFHVSRMANPI